MLKGFKHAFKSVGKVVAGCMIFGYPRFIRFH